MPAPLNLCVSRWQPPMLADASSKVNLEKMAASNNGSGMHKLYWTLLLCMSMNESLVADASSLIFMLCEQMADATELSG